ncbi:MAG: phospholipase A [Halomonas sp.]|nr:phospholipase A [Halomonas sp.]MDN6297198.1 phospholipase A [Halomonas sp.]MDN6314300.1 phospholipase A [Halomonas sp.]MDN6335932.1 phospholipase A [Halomonas sp.]
MIARHSSFACLGLLLAAHTGSVYAAPADQAALQARIDALHSEMAELDQQLTRLEAQQTPRFEASVYPHALTPTPPEEKAIEETRERRQLEEESSHNPFSITAHRTNYLFPVSYNGNQDRARFRDIDADGRADNTEVKFQFSAKFSLAEGLFGDRGDLYFGYTQRSWWQAYNTDSSSPFRETNYEPEIFIDFANDWNLLGWINTRNRVSLNHQSNGRSAPLSRSWNRVYLESTLQRGDWALSLAPHWRIPESDSEDDNPDIERYMGYGDIRLAKRFSHDQEISGLLRGNPSAGNYGTRLDYSWPAFNGVRGHVQYYYGYGESLIDYDHRVHRLSIGFSLNPLFTPSGLLR